MWHWLWKQATDGGLRSVRGLLAMAEGMAKTEYSKKIKPKQQQQQQKLLATARNRFGKLLVAGKIAAHIL